MANLKNKVVILLIVVLCGCSKKAPSTAISETTQKEIITIQKDIEKSTCENKSSFIARLDTIKSEVNNITLACNIEKKVLEENISKLKIIIMALSLIIFLSLYAIIKRR